MYEVLTELQKTKLVSRELVLEISDIIEINYSEKLDKKLDKKLEVIEVLPEDMQMVSIDRFFDFQKITTNAFFRGMEPSVIRILLSGFNIIHVQAGETIYNTNQPATSSKL
jgi:indole-3-glycerol phosphate synthase